MRGGYRPGGGRPRGAKTARLPPSVTTGAQGGEMLPLDFLSSLLNDPSQSVEVRLRAAGLALPYCHAKPAPMSAKAAKEIAARTAELGTEWEELLS